MCIIVSDDSAKELTSCLRNIPSQLLMLSAFLPVCKAMLDLGPEWLDRYVREVLYEAFANGMEAGVVTGDGDKKPIGMTRQVGENVVRSVNAYPEKATVQVQELSAATECKLMSPMAAEPNAKDTLVEIIKILVDPQHDYKTVIHAPTRRADDTSHHISRMTYI